MGDHTECNWVSEYSEFNMRYGRDSDDPGTWEQLNYGSDVADVALHNLEPNTNYGVVIEGKHNGDWSRWSGKVVFATSSPYFVDDFESNPSARWEVFAGGDGGAWFDTDNVFGHSGRGNGWLRVQDGWAAERIGVDLNRYLRRSRCTAGVYMQAVGPGAQAGIQVWNPNGWTKIAESYPWIPGDNKYHAVTIENLNLNAYSGKIYLQAIYGDQRSSPQYLRIDDMTLQCH